MMISGHNHSDFSENMQRCHDYIKGLEDERRKIQVFQRELPLCLELVTQAIETCKQQLSGTSTTTEYNLHGQSECSEQTSSDDDVVPVFEEFIPIKRASSESDGEEQESKKSKIDNNETSDCDNDGKISCSDKSCKKSDWLRSVQLWNQTSDGPDPPSKEDSAGKFTASEVKRNGGGGAFHPFKKEGGAGTAPAPPPASTSSSAENGGGNKKEGQSQRKARRCWSPELHRRFLQALQQLGGSHVATPKQIRDLMKVDGLTNDEVKSHLQKYRLHTRRPSSSTQSNNAQTPQFVVVGGLWVPPEYASMATTTVSPEAATKGIYAPVAAPPPPFQEPPPSPKKMRQNNKQSSQSNDRGGSYSKGGVQSCSPATSSSTHTTTTVPPAC
ncbi:myb-like transcription factor family protein [Perilla frutescens var. hirtella]|uniref:Myb-like transcription factor family protein n=1 Tax=Perilla frutescens var. hirtella TaxID=608512 RepID=A0AAD4JJJ4_PERFH|nr:myb-like transcription factor family protein [Perilla frutescens var. hirtella]